MHIDFKGTNYELTPEISAYARKKIENLRKFLGPRRVHTHAYVDIGKETGAHMNGRIWRADINFDADGTRFHAEAVEETLEAAIDRTVSELSSELQKARTRATTLARKGGSLFKSLMRGFRA